MKNEITMLCKFIAIQREYILAPTDANMENLNAYDQVLRKYLEKKIKDKK